MSALTPTYQFYAEHFASLSEDSFNAVLAEAQARVNERVAHRNLEGLPDDEIEAYQMAVCAVCETVDDPVVTSYSAGKVREEYSDTKMMSSDAVIDRYLAGTKRKLLYSTWL